MGMDVYGKQPTKEVGEYFRASIWSWRPIYSLTVELCAELLDSDTLGKMAHNDGAGPSDPETCREMAKRIGEWLDKNHGDYTVHVEEEAAFEQEVLKELRASIPGCAVRTGDYSASHEHLREWAQFLTFCGGFEVW